MAGSAKARLAEYRRRRDFARTPEPSDRPLPRAEGADLRFVVQKHAARSLHYDFRLEHEGALLSWSVPKGPSLRPSERRLAVRTEDHPLAYGDFEGVIPKGEYGGGTVMVWDRGSWRPEGDAASALRKGQLTFELRGSKLKGRWHLVRLRSDASRRENWLLFKGRDEAASERDELTREAPDSALSGRSLEEIGAAQDRVWHSSQDEQEIGVTTRDEARGRGARPGPRAVSKRARPATLGASELEQALDIDFPLTNLDKVLYPEQGLTKGELVAYLALVAEWMLPHVAGRPLTLVRCPDGRARPCFYQKHATQGVPPAIDRVEIAEGSGKPATYMAVHDLAGLVACAQLGALELHTWVCHIDMLERPDQLIFDVDPDEGLPWERVARAALELRARLADVGLESFVKTTGGKGLHVVAPVRRRLGWDAHKEFAHRLAQALERDQPELYTTNVRKASRKGRLYLDYLRNGRGATAVAPYSPRTREGATVATPLAWKELESGIDPRAFTIYTVTKRLGELKRDPWAPYFAVEQSIRASALRSLGSAR